LDQLRSLVAAIPYWMTSERGDDDERGQLLLDDARRAEIVEAWVPVVTPEGPGILTSLSANMSETALPWKFSVEGEWENGS
jgi:hypothetical protein